MALYAIGDLHLSLGSDKPMDVFGGAWVGYVDKLREGLSVIGPEDTTVLLGDLSWALDLNGAREDFEINFATAPFLFTPSSSCPPSSPFINARVTWIAPFLVCGSLLPVAVVTFTVYSHSVAAETGVMCISGASIQTASKTHNSFFSFTFSQSLPL